MIDESLNEKVRQVRIEKTRVSDHDAITFELDKKSDSMSSYDKIPVTLLEDDSFCKEIENIFREESGKTGNILIRHEAFKDRCRQAAMARVRDGGRKSKRKGKKK